ncbi:MAG: site-2 protease family protein [Candidatus Poribacteria bacterium]|nr:site-2 protease family protein [Candidatus Poribacteria bacterium]MDE0504955.1 site-2 protease family protein [Candidatus Poribacteria bacterium]
MLNPFDAILRVIHFIILLTFHEWGHAKSALMLGDPTARDEERLTLNPAAHIDIVGTVILPLVGSLFGAVFFGWAKPVPVDPRNLQNPKRDLMIIAAAGPVMNIICTFVILLAVKLLVEFVGPSIHREIYSQLQTAALISVFLAAFNMLPLFPLDGFSVVYGLLPWKQAQAFDRLRPYGMMILLGIIFLPSLLGIPNPVFMVISFVSYGIFNLFRALVGL